MKNLINIGGVERLRRIIIAVILFIVGFFWLSTPLQIVLYILSFILLSTGVTGICPLYSIFSLNRNKEAKKIPKICWIIFIIVLLLVTTLGTYFSIFFSKKFFLEDYNRMNNYYKQTLFNTGKEKRSESIKNYDLLIAEYGIFQEKYSKYHPYSVRTDKNLNNNLLEISHLISSLKETIYVGDLKQSHTELEKVRPIFQDILKRNGFSMLAISLVDFHDVMEKVISSADAKDATGVTTVYIEANEKLNAIELEANDDEIQAIRKSLEEVKSLAENNKMESISEKAGELKSNFVKVYLKRG